MGNLTPVIESVSFRSLLLSFSFFPHTGGVHQPKDRESGSKEPNLARSDMAPVGLIQRPMGWALTAEPNVDGRRKGFKSSNPDTSRKFKKTKYERFDNENIFFGPLRREMSMR